MSEMKEKILNEYGWARVADVVSVDQGHGSSLMWELFPCEWLGHSQQE